MNIITLKNMNAALIIPSAYTVIRQKLKRGAPSPFVKKIFSTAVNVSMKTNGFIALNITENEILLIMIKIKVMSARNTSVVGLLARKTVTINNVAIIILVRGSSL